MEEMPVEAGKTLMTTIIIVAILGAVLFILDRVGVFSEVKKQVEQKANNPKVLWNSSFKIASGKATYVALPVEQAPAILYGEWECEGTDFGGNDDTIVEARLRDANNNVVIFWNHESRGFFSIEAKTPGDLQNSIFKCWNNPCNVTTDNLRNSGEIELKQRVACTEGTMNFLLGYPNIGLLWRHLMLRGNVLWAVLVLQ